ncbi:hypothetical protein [Kitasatospora brasiliensis]|uniref:hypothetical protein n=1 Tax=Kitasatospora brasiliensis TaxID=3058040 RepID=UPI00292DF8F4|nr:hypothetical protein [Kitasatospora sp. K002]
MIRGPPVDGAWAADGCRTASVGGHRHTIRRTGFPDELHARTALRRFNEDLALCVITDPRQHTDDYLRDWLDEKELRLKPTTMARYRAYVEQDLIPALGQIPLADHAAVHAVAWILDNADRAALGRPACRARRPWRQNPRPHRQLPAHQQTRTEESSAAWPMWPGDHRATTS